MARVHHAFDAAELKDRIDILDVIGQDVDLRSSGTGYVGRCPFHSERSPSFSVWVHTKPHFWCFGCGVGGTVIDYVMQRHGVGFREACELLERGGHVGVAMPRLKHARPPDPPEPPPVPGTLIARWQRDLWDRENRTQLRRLIDERCWAERVIRRALIGWDGSRYTIPVKHPEQDGFGDCQRYTLDRSRPDIPKSLPYVDSGYREKWGSSGRHPMPYLVGRVLAWASETGYVVLSESLNDCLAALSAGVPCVANTFGTGSAPEVWAKWGYLLNGIERVLMCYDHDWPHINEQTGVVTRPGQDAAELVELLLSGRCRVLTLPDEGMDITSFISERGHAGFKRWIEARTS